MAFRNAVIGGDGRLIVEAIRSPNYVAGVSGWEIRKDGSAEFNDITIRGGIDTRDLDGVGLTISDSPGATTIQWHDGLNPTGAVLGALGGAAPGVGNGTVVLSAGDSDGTNPALLQLDSDDRPSPRYARLRAEDGVLINGTAPVFPAGYYTATPGTNVTAVNVANLQVASAALVVPQFPAQLAVIGTIVLTQLAAGDNIVAFSGSNFLAGAASVSNVRCTSTGGGRASIAFPFAYHDQVRPANTILGGPPRVQIFNTIAGTPTVQITSVFSLALWIPEAAAL